MAAEDATATAVPARAGKGSAQIDIDDIELQAQGYTRAMPRRFSLLSLMAMSYALLATWNGFGSAFGTGFTEFSSAGSIWTLALAGAMTAVTGIGMAELSSAYPVAGAQYYWSFVVASPEWAAFASYISAGISTLGWYLGLASVTNFIAAMVVGIAQLNHPDYVIERWHIYLVFVVVTWMAICLNIFGTSILPMWNKFILGFSLTTLVITMITILACAAPNYQSASFVFGDTTNSTGWDSNGLAFLLCMVNALYGFLGVDCGAHLCEEIPNPTVNVPKVIMFPVLIGFVTSFPFSISLSFVITDFERVISTPTGLPLIEVYYQATGSKAATSILMVMFAICFFGCATASITSSSRQMWSACRDDCFPLSRYWKQVHPRWQMPMNAALLCGTLVTLYGLIFLGSSAAFSSMVGACICFQTTSYVVPQGILAWRGRDKILPPRALNLGKFGLPLNVLACVWVFFIDVLYCIPTGYPVTVENMNWISVVIIGLVSFLLLAWQFSQRHVFKGPTINFEMLNAARQDELLGHRTIDGLAVGAGDDAIVEALRRQSHAGSMKKET
ncbi:amino acid/polyamine transporter I [Exophiala viscosa]|uniref:amino acid/polyamine transporter I n=1 Tax=Exophiala viscosa TaxID=2486360 RepID=UPI00219B0677|nr:amino acid/polyamine transporter I [Exophiala viscosa]